jgi:hypothetical protein
VKRIVGLGSILLLLSFSVVIASSASASAAMRKAVSNFAVQPTTADFGNTPVNATGSIPVEVTLDAGYVLGAPADVSLGSPWGDVFPASGSCEGFVGPGNCFVDLTFSPGVTGEETNVWQFDEVPANSGSGGSPSIDVDESGDGVACPSTDKTQLITVATGDGTLMGQFCFDSSDTGGNTGSFLQAALDGAPSVSGEGVIETVGDETLVYAQGPDLLLAGSVEEPLMVEHPLLTTPEYTNLVPRQSSFQEDAPLNTTGFFVFSEVYN